QRKRDATVPDESAKRSDNVNGRPDRLSRALLSPRSSAPRPARGGHAAPPTAEFVPAARGTAPRDRRRRGRAFAIGYARAGRGLVARWNARMHLGTDG